MLEQYQVRIRFMCIFRIALLVLLFMAGPSLVQANMNEECEAKSEGYEKATCYLESNQIDEYFEYVSFYYSGVKEAEGKYNPALGFRFMESVARYEKFDYAELATEIYFWGLQADKVKPYQPLVEREVNYLSAILNPEEKSEFNDYLERQDPGVFEKIRRFWKSRDVVRSSDKNERLLEHWERILYSKKNFTENDTTVYGTDERGNIYIRLGQPNEIRTGQFGSSAAEIRSKLYDLQDSGLLSTSGSALHSMQQEIMTSVIPAHYELWQYDDVGASDNEYIFFLFGRKGGDGPYGLRRSVEEFIPQEVFSRALGTRSGGRDIRVGNFLQFMYYSDLATTHMFFGNRLNEYDRAWRESIGGGRINAGYLRNNISRQKAEEATERIYNAAPGDASSFERQLQNYEMDVLEYRFLDEEGDPEHLYIVASSPHKLVEEYGFQFNHQGQRVRGDEVDIHMLQGIAYYDYNYAILGKNMDHLQQNYKSSDKKSGNSYTSHSIALTDNPESYAVVFSELYYTVEGNEDNPAAWSLLGVNKNDTKRIPALEFQPGELILSDLVLGSTPRHKIDVRGNDIGILEKGNKITKGDNLQVFFETYHFDVSGPGFSHYEVEYRVESTGRSWWPFSSSDVQSHAWEAAAGDWADYQFFEVEAIDRGAGTYELHIEITEKETGRQASRSIEFEVMEGTSD